MKSCKDIQTQLADFAVGALREPERVEIERHLQTCIACQRELSALQRAGALLDATEPEEIERILDQIADPMGTFYRFSLAHSILRRVEKV